ncbi:MAG: glycoside hydrolase family 5 protein [Butyrivibrio sp.]|nr:glycoside hydrolase family 5 protein [Butyrivibrio sp.]
MAIKDDKMIKKNLMKFVVVMTMTTMLVLSGCTAPTEPLENPVRPPAAEEVVTEETTETPATEDAVTKESTDVEEEAVAAETVEEETESTEEASVETASEEETKEDEDMEDETRNTPAWKIVNEMKVGWNLGNTLDAHVDGIKITDDPKKQETCWGNPETTQELIDAIMDLGFNTIRIPITWRYKLDEENNIDPAWMDRVNEIVDYAYNKGAYVIINVHHEDWNYPYYDNQEQAIEKITAIWSQVSDRFADYDEHLVFELQNEPRKVGTDVEWTGGDDEGREVVNDVNMAAYDVIRAKGGNNATRLITFPGYAAASYTDVLKAIQLPENDDCVAVSVHAYSPYEFALNTQGRSTWDNDTADIIRIMRDINRLFIQNNIPVIIGEFGALNKDNEAERAEWVKYYLGKAKEIGVPCVWWDNGCFDTDGENFGIIDRRTLELPYPELIKAIQETVE